LPIHMHTSDSNRALERNLAILILQSQSAISI
jgi:hypothetical protein